MKKFTALLLTIIIIATGFVACSNTDPNVKHKNGTKDDGYVVDTAEDKASDLPIDDDYFANRAYELKYLIATDSFNSPSEISVSKLVQYEFCRLYYTNLVDMPRKGIKMREATAKQINAQIKKDFGAMKVDVTKSDLYNPSKKIFEMWEPLYGTDLYFTTETTDLGNGSYEISASYFSDEAKFSAIGSATITVGTSKDGSQYIKALE